MTPMNDGRGDNFHSKENLDCHEDVCLQFTHVVIIMHLEMYVYVGNLLKILVRSLNSFKEISGKG